MNDFDEPAKVTEQNENDHEKMLAIELSGKDTELWERREPRFVERLKNSFKSLLGADIQPEITANSELHDAANILAKSAQEALKVPQLNNLERQASVELILAEAKEKEANARKTNIEADMLEIKLETERLERKSVLQSQAIIDLLVRRGELIPVEKDGELIFVYQKRKL